MSAMAVTPGANVDDFRRNLAAVHQRIASACQRAGRDVRLLPVSKTFDEARLRLRLRLAYAAGRGCWGRTRVDEKSFN